MCSIIELSVTAVWGYLSVYFEKTPSSTTSIMVRVPSFEYSIGGSCGELKGESNLADTIFVVSLPCCKSPSLAFTEQDAKDLILPVEQ